MLKIGLLGCGRIGQVHARGIGQIEGARVAAVSDFFPEAAEALAAKTGAEVQTTDAILESADIDAVIIGTPTDTHFDIIHKAAANGKAIFCEKPIDLSADRIRACLKAVADAQVPFMTAFNRRFDPNFAALKAQINAGAIGKVEMLTILSRDPSPPPISYIKSSGGIFRDMMIHDLDMARFLLGEDPVSLHATASCLVDPKIGAAGDVDTAIVVLKTASGKLCQISNSRRASYGYDQRIEIHGETGMLRADNVLENTVEIANGEGFQRAPTLNFFLERYEAAYRAEISHFVDAVTNATAPDPDGVDGLKAQIMADAADHSYQSGETIMLKFD